MRLKLRISEYGSVADYLDKKHFRFAVIDLDKAKNYPVNFVCLLPMKIKPDGKDSSIFSRVFGKKSFKVAKSLLTKALEVEDNLDVKSEIKRRLKLLEPQHVFEKTCTSCGKVFKSEHRKGFRQKFCPKCLKKKFGGRT
jgi:hypothetical protein